MLTKQQLEIRKKSIGSSDMAAILGISNYKTIYDVWLEKTNKLMEEDFVPNAAADAGNRFERSVLAWASEELGKLRRNVYMVAPNGLPVHAYIDAVVVDKGEPVEAKTGGLFGPLWGQWGEPGTGDVPEPYIVQAHIEMLCAEREICHMPAFLGGRGFQMYHIPLNKDLMEIITTKAAEFWEKYVKTDTPPPESAPSLDLMPRVKRTEGKRVRISSESIIKWKETDKIAKEAEKVADEAKAKMLAELGDGEMSEVVEIDGKRMELAYVKEKGKRVDVKVLKEKYPEIAKEVSKTTSKRTARLKKAKEEKV